MKKRYFLFYIISAVAMTALSQQTVAQRNKQGQSGQRNKEVSVNLRATVIDEDGRPVPDAIVTVGEGAVRSATNAKGLFSVKAKANGVVLVEALGYASKVIDLSKTEWSSSIILEKELLLAGERDMLELPSGYQTTIRGNTGAVSRIKGGDLETYPDLLLSNTLQGRIPGLVTRQNSSGLGNNSASLFVRGLSRGENDGALTIVDGIERPIDFLNPEEIEHIEVLKDATSKILYGPRAANGVILITTKRGKDNTRLIKASAQYGVSMPTRMPRYLNSADYAVLYNEARANDGMSPFYSQRDIEGYRNSSGAMDQRYPDVDFYDYFLNRQAPFRKANFEYSGGGEASRYAFLLGYTGANGFEKVGRTPKQDRINLRGNLDFQVTPAFRAFIDAAAIVETREWSGLDQSQVFSALSVHRPNEYPLILTDPSLQGAGAVLGQAFVPPVGGSFLRPNNLYGSLMYGGFTQHNYFYGQSNFGLDLDLQKITKGLSIKTTFTFDNYQFFQNGKTEEVVAYASVYSGDVAGSEDVEYVALNKRVIQADQVRQNESIVRSLAWITNINYNKKIGIGEFNAALSHFYFRNEDRAIVQDIENSNTTLRVDYNIAHKYYLEATAAMMGSGKFSKENRYAVFPAVGAAWILSEENFLKNNRTIDFLKLKTSFGVLGYDRSTAFYLYQNRWYNNGNMQFGQPNNTSGSTRTSLELIGNPALTYEKSRELNVGTEGLALKKRLRFEVNYFNTYRYDMILNPDFRYSSFAGGLFPRENIGATRNKGLEVDLAYGTEIEQLRLTMGANYLYSRNEVVVTNEVAHPDAYLRQTGLPSDAMFGLVSNGIIRNAQQLANVPFQNFGPYGIGDLSYEDLNGDGMIDDRDRTAIGNSFPRNVIALNMQLQYKGFGLYLLGTSEIGAHKWATNSYFRNNGEGKYSITANDRFHPVNNPDGTAPDLTTTADQNNNQQSTFWLANTSFARLKNAELSYALTSASAIAKVFRIYVRGTNLLLASEMKDLDPEALNAGVTNYPIYRTFTAGISVQF